MYLTESTLENFLEIIFPSSDWIHDKTVPKSNILSRPDYRNDDLKLIVEFDGFHHYTLSSYIISDMKKDKCYTNMGYNVVRIPYFVQMSSDVIQNLFKININLNQNYPHGFVDKKATLPADFCYMGIEKFKEDLNRFAYIRPAIINSLHTKIKELGDVRIVIPPTLIDIL